MISVKKITSKTIVHVMELTLIALLFAQAYFNHKDEVDESIAKLKATLEEKGENTDGE